MVKACFVAFCKTGRKSDLNNKTKYSLFKAPNDEYLLERWRERIPLRERELRKQDRICEKHFEERYVVPRFQQTRHVEFFEDNIRPKLTPDAVPTLFPDADPSGKPLRFKEKIVSNELCVLSKNIIQELPNVQVSENECVPVCYKCLVKKCSSHIMCFNGKFMTF